MTAQEQSDAEKKFYADKKVPPDFLDGIKLTPEEAKRIENLKVSKDMRILAFSQVQQVFKRPALSQEQAAARYYEAKGLMDLIPEIQK